MMGSASHIFAAISVVLVALSSPIARSADLGVTPPATAVIGDVLAMQRDYLARRAALLMIRAAFDVVQRDRLASLLRAEARSLGSAAPAEHQQQQLDIELLSEGSYFITSLRYLVEVGGAAWPGDRADNHYENDALVQLPALQRRLIEVVEERHDPLPILVEADRIHWQTEGYVVPPPGEGRFDNRDALVERALAEAVDRAAI